MYSSSQSRMRVSTVLSVLLCLATCRFAFAFRDGLLDNGNFEQAPKSSELNGTIVLKPHAVPKWQISGFVEYIKAGQKQGDMLLVVPEGYAAVRLGNEASIKQLINVTKGMFYSLTFSAARTCAQEERVNVSVAPDYGVLPIQTLYSSNGWDSYAWAFRASYDVAEILIHNPGVEEDPACGPLIDSVAIRALYPPKPTSQNLLKNGDFEEASYRARWRKKSAIAQVARTIVGKTYQLTFAVGDASNSCEGSMIVEAFAGRDTVKVPYESKGKGGYKRAVLRFVATTTRTRIMFLSTYYHMRSDDYASLCGPVVDDVKLLSVRKPRRLA
ncbi:UNVERIFIED_CONTAM: hypothetical protein Sradi_5011500 [Sesamum radiatum]|uniref:DUF642 domain-containing protein n=1 Tax=Sesamum radiatum TaxID=300843 RepID=A0AAW2MII7_SESRA